MTPYIWWHRYRATGTHHAYVSGHGAGTYELMQFVSPCDEESPTGKLRRSFDVCEADARYRWTDRRPGDRNAYVYENAWCVATFRTAREARAYIEADFGAQLVGVGRTLSRLSMSRLSIPPRHAPNFAAGVEIATRLGHQLENDPPMLSLMDRQTCTRCGLAVVGCSTHAYGSALEDECGAL